MYLKIKPGALLANRGQHTVMVEQLNRLRQPIAAPAYRKKLNTHRLGFLQRIPHRSARHAKVFGDSLAGLKTAIGKQT